MKSCSSNNKLDTYDDYTAVGFNQKFSEQGLFHIYTWTKPFTNAEDKVFVQPGKTYGVLMAIAEGTKQYGDLSIPTTVKTLEIPQLNEIYYTKEIITNSSSAASKIVATLLLGCTAVSLYI